MKDLLEGFARALVGDPHRVVVRESSTPDGLRFELEVAPHDRGRVIGNRGRTVDALRTLLEFAASRRGQSVRLEIVE